MIPNTQGLIYVNGRPLESYFSSTSERDALLQGLVPEDGLEKWNIWCVVKGGGIAAQAQALKVAIARGRVVHEPEMEETLAECTCPVAYYLCIFTH
jgi:small subunit ribosomal protein S9